MINLRQQLLPEIPSAYERHLVLCLFSSSPATLLAPRRYTLILVNLERRSCLAQIFSLVQRMQSAAVNVRIDISNGTTRSLKQEINNFNALGGCLSANPCFSPTRLSRLPCFELSRLTKNVRMVHNVKTHEFQLSMVFSGEEWNLEREWELRMGKLT